jgi:hypothetical protein
MTFLLWQAESGMAANTTPLLTTQRKRGCWCKARKIFVPFLHCVVIDIVNYNVGTDQARGFNSSLILNLAPLPLMRYSCNKNHQGT